MKTKIIIILIVLLGLGIGGFFVYKNFFVPEVEETPLGGEKMEEEKEIPEEQAKEKAKEQVVLPEEGEEEGVIFEKTADVECAKDGETFSRVSDKRPDSCCEGLKEWLPIPDTRFSIADVCYEIGPPSKSSIGLCIKCGDGVCTDHPIYTENPCNCPEDCKGKNKSMFQSIEEFCQSNDWKLSLSKACQNQETIKGSPICKLCNF